MKIKIFNRTVFEIEGDKNHQPEGRSITPSGLSNPDDWLVKLLGGLKSGGVDVNANTSLSFSAYYGSIKILAETMGILTASFRERKKNKTILFPNDAGVKILSEKPNSYMTPQVFHEILMIYALSRGNGYGLIFRDNAGNPSEIVVPENQSDVYPYLYKERLYYFVKGISQAVTPENIFHIKGLSFNGYTGLSLIQAAYAYISGGIASQKYSNDLFNDGGAKRVVLKYDQKLDPDIKEQIKKDWIEKYGANSKHDQTPAILQGGVTADTIGVSPKDAALIESKKMSIVDFSRYSRVPLHMLNHFENSTGYNSLEQLGKEFSMYTMKPWVTKFQQEADAKLRRYDRSKGHYVYNLKSLVQQDSQTLADMISKIFPTSSINPDEIREMLFDMDPIEGGEGDTYYTAVNVHSGQHAKAKIDKILAEVEKLKIEIKDMQEKDNNSEESDEGNGDKGNGDETNK